MRKTSRQPLLRALTALFHARYLRRENFRFNTEELQRRTATISAQWALRLYIIMDWKERGIVFLV